MVAVRAPEATLLGSTFSAAELMAADLPQPRWAIPGVLPVGLTLLAGKPKIGKSWLTLGWALAVASGGRALGTIPVEGGSVLYLALEDTDRRLQSRLAALLDGSAPPERLLFARNWARQSACGLRDLQRQVQQMDSPRLVVIDTLGRFRTRPPDRGNQYHADNDALAQLAQLAGEENLAVVAVHHFRKERLRNGDWLEDISGTTGLTGAADTLLGLERRRGELTGWLHGSGRDLDEFRLPLTHDRQSGKWLLVDDAERALLSPERREVLDAVRTLGCASPGKIAEKVGKPGATVRQLLRGMLDAGQLHRGEDGTYRAPGER
jgi:hypothetical protein